ncbi:MAG TPA: leucyl aminopeptidase [Candidatus Hydrogenedentes bacterium]|nr:leucyl aminopeptidase [Candidatus Hydrogenedentota bacterium]
MHIEVVRKSKGRFEGPGSCLVTPVWESETPPRLTQLDEPAQSIFNAAWKKKAFTGKAQDCFWLPVANKPYDGLLLIGFGKPEACSPETVRRCAGAACTILQQQKITRLYLDWTRFSALPAHAFLEGISLGQYDFSVYKKHPDDSPAPAKIKHFTVLISNSGQTKTVQEECEQAALICAGVNGARHLGNTPANELTPAKLAEFAQGAANSAFCECTILDKTQIASLGMNAFLGVARGSSQPPKLILLHYRHPKAKRTLALVGKGITFDSGGISIKDADGMHEMKYDMCGAAAVLCTLMNVVELKPAINVIGVMPVCENKTGADAQRPGDIIRAYNGVTIEVNNTDAEGRLILADALAFTADKYRPDFLVDIATLTGGAQVALGHFAAAILGTHEALANELIQIGQDCGERLWRLPLWDDYDKLIEGTHADLCNIGPPREASTIAGGCFLKHFIGDTPWAHIDIAATAYGVKHIPYWDEKSANGFGVRLLTRWILRQAAAF